MLNWPLVPNGLFMSSFVHQPSRAAASSLAFKYSSTTTTTRKWKRKKLYKSALPLNPFEAQIGFNYWSVVFNSSNSSIIKPLVLSHQVIKQASSTNRGEARRGEASESTFAARSILLPSRGFEEELKRRKVSLFLLIDAATTPCSKLLNSISVKMFARLKWKPAYPWLAATSASWS